MIKICIHKYCSVYLYLIMQQLAMISKNVWINEDVYNYMQPLNFISDQSIDFAAPWWADSFFQKMLTSRIVGV